ncbi:hypothetical protein RQP46_008127 [Phenoliferia psychrophenolica]
MRFDKERWEKQNAVTMGSLTFQNNTEIFLEWSISRGFAAGVSVWNGDRQMLGAESEILDMINNGISTLEPPGTGAGRAMSNGMMQLLGPGKSAMQDSRLEDLAATRYYFGPSMVMKYAPHRTFKGRNSAHRGWLYPRHNTVVAVTGGITPDQPDRKMSGLRSYSQTPLWPAMATIQSLAAEVLSNIFELAHDPHTPSTMKSAALVCRAWRGPAQRTLFLDVVVPVFHGGSKGRKAVHWDDYRSKWDNYRSKRLYTPRRVELMDSSSDMVRYRSTVPTMLTSARISSVIQTWQTPFNEIGSLLSNNSLPNLTRIDFPQCKRKDLEDEAAAADLLDECKRRLIRIVCWEEFI